MAIEIATPFAPSPAQTELSIIRRRVTFKGVQSVVSGHFSDEIVTIAPDGGITCTCGLDRYFVECPHIRMVSAQETLYAIEARERATHVDLFDLHSYVA